MAPVPYTAGFRLDIEYDGNGFPHVVQLPCDSPSGSAPYSLSLIGGGTRLVSDCVADFAALWKGFLHTTDGVTGYTLYENVSGIFIPRQSAAAAVAGTAVGAAIPASQATITFRDLPYHIFRLMAFETIIVPPGKINYPTGLAPLDAIIESFLPGSTATHPIHEWVRSRGDNALSTTTGGTATYNRKLRRERGLA